MRTRVSILICSLFLTTNGINVPVLTDQERILSGHSGEITSVVFHPKANLLATASMDGTVRLWDVAHAKLLKSIEAHTGSPRGESKVWCGAVGVQHCLAASDGWD